MATAVGRLAMAKLNHNAPPLWLLALITFGATLAMHIFVPALPIVAVDLHASISSVQMTVSL